MSILTKKRADTLKLTIPERELYYVGELFPTIFNEDEIRDFYEGMPLVTKIIHIGTNILNSKDFPKLKCPVCRREESLIPYFCGASILSGCHVLKFHCLECKELIADNNNSDYYHKIRDIVIKQHTDFNKPGGPILISDFEI